MSAAETSYTFRGGASTAMESRRSEVLLAGSAGTGKSFALLVKVHLLALKYPGSRHAIIRKTAASLGNTAVKTWEAVTQSARDQGIVTYFGGSNREPPGYRYANGSSVILGGIDKPDKIMSSELDTCYIQEATELQLKDWQAIVSRLRNGKMPYQQVLADCNPSSQHHWLKKRCDSGITQYITSRHEDNPRFANEDGTLTPDGEAYITNILGNLVGIDRLRLLDGLWVSAEGVIYTEFNEGTHVIEPFDIPKDWSRTWVMDFGHRNPFVCQFWAHGPDGDLYMYREIYMTNVIIDEHVRSILDIVSEPIDGYNGTIGEPMYFGYKEQWNEPRPIRIIADHDATDRATVAKHLGMFTTPATKGVSDGVQLTKMRLRDARIKFFRNALVKPDERLRQAGKPYSTVQEFPGYKWEMRNATAAHGEIEKDEPHKEDDHGMDCVRYIVRREDASVLSTIRVPSDQMSQSLMPDHRS